MTKQYKISFPISKEINDKVQGLPRSFNLSEELRKALANILYKVKAQEAKEQGPVEVKNDTKNNR